MIGGRVANVIERFARDSDDVRLANFERVCSFDVEGKLLSRPTEYSLPDLAPLWANWNLGANSSHAVAVGILKCNVNITVCLDFCINNAASKRVPFLLRRHSFLSRDAQFHLRSQPFSLVNLRWRD